MDLKQTSGSGTNPISLVTILTQDRQRVVDFLTAVFAWQMQPAAPDITAFELPAGPIVSVRQAPDETPAIFPYLYAADIEETLARVVSAGGELERAAWTIPMVATMARFREPSGTIFGLTTLTFPGANAPIPMPLGTNPRPPENSLCSIEVYSADRAKSALFFEDVFGWSTQETMPQYTAFDAGTGVGGVFQAHTPVTPVMVYFYAADVRAKLDQVAAAGGAVFGEPIAMPSLATFGYFAAPDGLNMGLIGPAP